MQCLINEVGAVCVKLPLDVCPTSCAASPRYLCVVMDSRRDPATLGTGLPFLPRHEVISTVCAERAVLLLEGTLRVQRRRLEPDAYIRRWRRALDEAISIGQLRSHVGLTAIASFRIDATAEFMAARPRWINPPYSTPSALLAARGVDAQSSDGWCSLAIDLASPHGARDAWWLNDWMRGTDGDSTLCISPSSTTSVQRPAALQEVLA